jgi:hypothetical protein
MPSSRERGPGARDGDWGGMMNQSPRASCACRARASPGLWRHGCWAISAPKSKVEPLVGDSARAAALVERRPVAKPAVRVPQLEQARHRAGLTEALAQIEALVRARTSLKAAQARWRPGAWLPRRCWLEPARGGHVGHGLASTARTPAISQRRGAPGHERHHVDHGAADRALLSTG